MNTLLLLLPLAFLGWLFWRSRPEVRPPELLADLRSGRALLVDVREPGEWASGTARGAALLPLSDLRGDRRQWDGFLARHPGRPLFLYCQSGARSAMAAARLRRAGVDARNAGSLAAVTAAGWPTSSEIP